MNKDQNFRNSMRLSMLTFKMGGITFIYPKSMTWYEYMKYNWFFFFNMSTMGSDFIGAMVWFINGVKSGKRFEELTFNALCSVFSSLGFLKIYFIFKNRNIAIDLMCKLQEIFPESLDGRIKNIVKENMRFLNPIVTLTFYLNFILVFLFNLFPLATMAYHYHTTGEVKLLLPYYVAYPFNSFDIRIWPIIYLRQMWDGIFSIIGVVGPDTFFYACCSHIRLHFQVLQHRFERIVAEAVKDPNLKNELNEFMDQPLGNKNISDKVIEGEIVDDEKLRRVFIEQVKTHRELIALVVQLDRLYSMATLIHFVFSSLLICLTGFNITATDSSELPQFLMLLTSCLSQIFMFCLFGNMIKESSVQVSDAIYHSHWYLADKKTKHLVYFSLLRSQQACKLTAFNFADVDLMSFTSILSTSWSYFALLNTMYNPESEQGGTGRRMDS